MYCKSFTAALALALCGSGASAATVYTTAKFVPANVAETQFALKGFGRVTEFGGGGPTVGLRSALLAAPLRESFHDIWDIDTVAMAPGDYRFSTVIDARGDLDFGFVFLTSLNGGVKRTIDFTVSPDGKQATGEGSFTIEATCAVAVCLWLDLLGTQPAGGRNAGYDGPFNAAAVPEPEAWALMLTGLAGLGWWARRRLPAAA